MEIAPPKDVASFKENLELSIEIVQVLIFDVEITPPLSLAEFPIFLKKIN